MIEETAEVVAIKGQQALLQTERKSACQSCSVKSGCGTSTIAKVVGKRSTQIVVENTLNLSAGDHVVVAIEEAALVQGSLLVYLLPLVLMLFGGAMADYLWDNEGLTVLVSLTGLAFSIFVVRYLLQVSGLKNAIQPHLIRRIP